MGRLLGALAALVLLLWILVVCAVALGPYVWALLAGLRG